MQKNSDNFSMQEALRLAKSPAGQQLLALLQQSDPDAMKKAMQQASKGDYSQIQQTLAPLLASEDVQKLLRQMGG
ncbi:MAG: hypothetical protein J6B67_01040 [Oscillospiraceae bacterium]|nr:hypothetical protein [Oscillospiraceae bacterium]